MAKRGVLGDGRFTPKRALCVVAVYIGVAICPVPAFSAIPAESIVGTWEAQTTRNAFQMRVVWNPQTGRYEGTLARFGALSQQVGFTLGELCWTATITASPSVLQVQEKWRWGTSGVSTRVQWHAGIVRLDRSNPGELVTSSTVFHKVDMGRPQLRPSPALATGATVAAAADAREPAAHQAPPTTAPQATREGPRSQREVAYSALSSSTRAELQANPPPNWISELPTVEAIRRATPAGRSPRDTVLRQAAAFVVWQDLVELFMGKSFFDLRGARRSEPGVSRYFEYSDASAVDSTQGHAHKDVLTYADLADFRKEVLGRHLSPAAQHAYWQVRTGTMAARDQERAKVADRTKTLAALLDRLPSTEIVESETVGDGDRDTEARVTATFVWLARMAERLSYGNSKAGAYRKVGSLASRYHTCKTEPGCTSGDFYAASFYCERYYETSPAFVRALLDKYVPKEQQSIFSPSVPNLAAEEAEVTLTKALAMSAEPVRTFFPACGAQRQFGLADEQAFKIGAEIRQSPDAREAMAKMRELKRQRAAKDADDKQRALADGKRAADRIDSKAFGVPLGVESPVPDCEAVGFWEGPTPSSIDRHHPPQLSNLRLVAEKTCLLLQDDGTMAIRWADNALPSWARWVVVQLKDDVVVSMKVTIPSGARPPAGVSIGFGLVGSLLAAASNDADQARYERALKEGPENVAKAQKDLRTKYGEPTKPIEIATFRNGATGGVSRRVEEPEWAFPGVQVKYDADRYEDTILIELDSVARARTNEQRKKEAAEGKL